MPIQLTNPLVHNPGRGLAVESYAQAKILGFEAIVEPTDQAQTTVRVQYGDTVDGKWVGGQAAIEYITIKDTQLEVEEVAVLDDEGDPTGAREYVEVPAVLTYSNWTGSTYPTSTGNLLYTELAIALYTYLLAQAGFEGTIV